MTEQRRQAVTRRRRRSTRKRRRRRARACLIFALAALAGGLLLGAGRGAAGAGSPAIAPEDSRPVPQGPAAVGPEEWALALVSPSSPLPEDFAVTLKQLKNGQAVDERCYPDLQDMMDACRAAGLSPVICSSYRTVEKQEALFQGQVDKQLAQGLSQEQARTAAAQVVAVPGTSEHHLGLAVDIVDLGNQNLDESQERTAVQVWLMEHSWEYGFILRYPSGKSRITGIVYEPWHYRYVGRDAARDAQGLCLEEYLERLGAPSGI